MIPFLKMNGAGNDFVIIDAIKSPILLTKKKIQEIADRANTLTQGCDQLIVLEPSEKGDVFMRIYNADGGEVDACGNATRCIAWLMMEKKKNDDAVVETKIALLAAKRAGHMQVRVDMGQPKLDWQDIPLASPMNTLHTGIRINDLLSDPVAVSMGNPHAVFFVDNAELLRSIDMGWVSNELEPFYPQGVNVSVAYIEPESSEILVRVWERGVGETLACGTAACAVLVAAIRRSLLTSDNARIHFLPGTYTLEVKWPDATKADILLSGPVEMEFEGVFESF